MLMTLRIGLPVCPRHAPERIFSEKSAIRSRTSCTCATTSVPSMTSEVPFGMRNATCSTERFSDTLIRAPANIASRCSSSPDSSASWSSRPTVSSVMRFFE